MDIFSTQNLLMFLIYGYTLFTTSYVIKYIIRKMEENKRLSKHVSDFTLLPNNFTPKPNYKLDDEVVTLRNWLHRQVIDKIKFNVWITNIHEIKEINDTNYRNISNRTIFNAELVLIDWSPTHYLVYKSNWIKSDTLVLKPVINDLLSGISKSETHVLNYLEPITRRVPKPRE